MLHVTMTLLIKNRKYCEYLQHKVLYLQISKMGNWHAIPLLIKRGSSQLTIIKCACLYPLVFWRTSPTISIKALAWMAVGEKSVHFILEDQYRLHSQFGNVQLNAENCDKTCKGYN